MVKRARFFIQCKEMLESSGCDTAGFDTLCVFQDILKDKYPLTKPDEEIPDDIAEKITDIIKKRCEGYPLQYVLGEWDFWKYTFRVGEGVLIPRPDTETLIENILDICRKNKLQSPKILDLCSGSGCIAITLDKEIPQSEVWAVEKYDSAFEYLEENIRLNNSEVRAVKADVLSPETARKFKDFDIIASNPPYLTAEEMQDLQREVRAEPETALYGGDDGLDFYREITPVWRNSLKTGGYISYEIGMNQHNSVAEILKSNNFININFTEDTGGIIRIVTAEKQEENKNG